MLLIVVSGRVELHRHGVALVVDDVRARRSRSHVYSTSTSARTGHGCGLKTTTGRISSSGSMSICRAIDCTARVERARRDRRRVAELVARVLVRRLDRRAGERVVELVEEQQLPRLASSSACGYGWTPSDVGDGAPLLGAQQQVLGAPVPALDAGVRRVAAAARGAGARRGRSGGSPFAATPSKKRRSELGSSRGRSARSFSRSICSMFAIVGPPPWLPTP